MNKEQILESKGIDSNLFEFYYVTNNEEVISPEFDYDDNIIKNGEQVYQDWLYEQENPKPTELSKMEVLEQEVIKLEKENRLLKAQVEVLSQTSDFHEELIVEMANKVYA